MSTQHCYVATLDLVGGVSYISLHRSRIGAEAEVIHWAHGVGISATTLGDLDDAPTVESYGISYLPLLPLTRDRDDRPRPPRPGAVFVAPENTPMQVARVHLESIDKLHNLSTCAPGTTRTCDLGIRSLPKR